ncbi:MAG: sulfate transporter [Gemmatimonadetes bacterium]|nr:sulfate transporter [Gemmatimonadota bacterium]
MPLRPKLFTTLRGYTREQALADATAGVIVGVVALPLAIAFAIASGVTPDRGLWTAIIAGFLISALGGSRVQVGGPTGAFVVIVYGIVQRYGVDGLLVATIMAGMILVLFGLARFGTAIKFIPSPVVTGFTSGIAVIICASQLRDFLGLRMAAVPAAFLAKWPAFWDARGSVNASALLVATLSLVIIVAWPRVSRRVPGPFVALVVSAVLVRWLHLPVETIGSRFGEISASLPSFALPHVSVARLGELAAPAFTIALLGAVESLLSAVVADGMTGGRHRSNMELVAQGVANIVTPMFGGIPATGAIARTATNVRNGGRTPVAGIVHAVTLLLITLFAGRWAALIPMSALAAILVVVSYHMCEWRTFRAELRSPRSDVVVLLATFFLTVLVDLTVAIEVGMVLAAFLFMRRMADVAEVGPVTHALRAGSGDDDEAGDDGAPRRRRIPAWIEVYEVSGPFFFGAAQAFRDTMRQVAGRPRVLILRLRAVPLIDATGIRALLDVVDRTRHDGTMVLVCEVQPQPLAALQRAGAMTAIGEGAVFATLDEALALAEEQPKRGVTGSMSVPR